MPLYSFEGAHPDVHPTAFIAPTATLVGSVSVGPGASVWYGAVVRADDCRIVIAEGANVQDNSVLHAAPDVTLEIGEHATIGHGCVVHGLRVGARALVGNGSTLLDGSVLGDTSLLAAGSVLTPGTEIPAGVLAAGIPARVTKEITEGSGPAFWIEANGPYYRELAERHRTSTQPL